MDFAAGYRASTEKRLPLAEMVHDRFHASQLLSEAVDEVRRELGVAVDDPAVFKPEGQANSFGYGFTRWDRFDMPRTRVQNEMKGYTLHHEVQTNIPDFVASLLDGGGQVTPTAERLRIGVPITSGMSTQEDLQTGGSSYFFTRIKTAQSAARKPGITFKIGNLSRVDAYSFSSDVFGDIRPGTENEHGVEPARDRALTPTEWRSNAARGRNEAIFKNGFHLLDDVDKIRVRSALERDKILKSFQDHGYSKLPDGRSIEDVVSVIK